MRLAWLLLLAGCSTVHTIDTSAYPVSASVCATAHIVVTCHTQTEHLDIDEITLSPAACNAMPSSVSQADLEIVGGDK